MRGDAPLSLGLDLAGGVRVTYRPDLSSVPERYAELPRTELLAMAKDTLADRLTRQFDTLPDVVLRSDGSVVVSLPGEHDQREVLETLGQTYRLTFRQVLATYSAPPTEPRGDLRPYQGQWLDLDAVALDGEMLEPHSIRVDSASQHTLEGLGRGAAITFEFRAPHDETFARLTRESIGEWIAILLDDEVEWAGRVDNEIRGPGSLHGGYTADEAAEIAGLLRAGHLPFSLDVESLSGVGPSLGKEMQDRGRSALVWSVGLLALLLTAAYGHRPALWLTAWVSLACLLTTILGLIAAFDLTVDLVAIAGLVLSVGMGMDAFILVFEAFEGRADELSARSPLGRLRAVYGFGGEGRTLVHANATTLLVVLLLFLPDRLASFALFLLLGIGASLVTLVFTRWLLETCARKRWLEPRDEAGSRHPLVRLRTARPGLFRWRGAYVAVLCFALVGSACWLQHERPGAWFELGADFRPGMQLQISAPTIGAVDDLVETLQARHPEITARTQIWEPPRDVEASGESFLVTLEGPSWQEAAWRSDASTDDAEDTRRDGPPTPAGLLDALREHDMAVHGMHSIDARLSAQRMLTSSSVLLGSFALLGVYLRVLQPRLDAAFSGLDASTVQRGGRIFVGTVLAVLLDVAVVLAGLGVLGIPLGMPVLAAILTIIGYSVNDSMVLWSHVSRPADDGRSAAARIEEGVDRILGRTLLTSLSTMVPAITILVCGLEPLTGFAWAILLGTVAGTLSSIFVVASFAAVGNNDDKNEDEGEGEGEKLGTLAVA
ncbi:MAG: hypothetical protein AAGE94_15010 [Acidobacteriota bacterium]